MLAFRDLKHHLYKDFVLFVTFDVQAQICTSTDTNIIWKFGQRFENRLEKKIQTALNSIAICLLVEIAICVCLICLIVLSDL